MKSKIQLIIAALISLASIPIVFAIEPPFPRPVFVPSTPPVSKEISEYSAADVLGVEVTASDQFPADHPYLKDKKYSSGIKEKWPGAKVATQIDVMVQIVLDAPAEADVNIAMRNVAYILQNIFDLPAVAKADALVRIVNAQTDPLKRNRAVNFAFYLFDEFLDPRILAFIIERLDDASVSSIMRREEASKIVFTVRGDAKDMILQAFRRIKLEVDKEQFRIGDEAARCAAMKGWLNANWALVTAKCAEARAKPDRYIPDHPISCWDLRW